MRKFVRRWGTMALLASAGVVLAKAQGPIDGYMKPRGDLDVAVGFSVTGASRFRDGEGVGVDLGFRARLLSVFAAYGLTDRVGLVASVPFVITDATSGLQDGALFVKALLLSTELKAKGDGGGKLDVVAALGLQGPLSDYAVVANGAIGQQAKIVQPRLLAQWNGTGYFVSALAGYNYRFDGLDEAELMRIQQTRPGYRPKQPADNVNFLLRAGIPTERVYVDAWIELQRTFGGEDYTAGVDELPQAYDVDYAQVGGTLYYSETPHWGFAASGASVVGGRNTSAFWRLSATIVYKL